MILWITYLLAYLWLSSFFIFQYFGQDFIHDGTNTPIKPPQYIDPYELLEEERISQPAPPLN